MPSLELVPFLVAGIAFLAASWLIVSKKRKKKSTDQRLAEMFEDYDRQMDRFRG